MAFARNEDHLVRLDYWTRRIFSTEELSSWIGVPKIICWCYILQCSNLKRRQSVNKCKIYPTIEKCRRVNKCKIYPRNNKCRRVNKCKIYPTIEKCRRVNKCKIYPTNNKCRRVNKCKIYPTIKNVGEWINIKYFLRLKMSECEWM